MKEELLEKAGAKAMELLDALAAQLGVTIEQIWGVLVKQCYVDAWFSFAVCVISLMFFAVGATVIYKGYKSDDRYWADTPPIAVSFFLCLVCSVVFSVNVGDIFQMFNPEYFALREIASLLKLVK